MNVDAWSAIAAIANVCIALVALLVAKEAGDAARRSAQAETEALEVTQNALSDERERDLYAQATRVAAYEVRPLTTRFPTSFCVVNNSDQPVYEVGVALTRYGHHFDSTLVDDERHERFARIVVLPPGQWRVSFGASVRGMSGVSAVELAFRDQAGKQWLRTSQGVLNVLDGDMITHFQVSMPYTPYALEPYSR